MWASVLPLQAVKHIEQLHCFYYCCWPSAFPENTDKDKQHKQTIQGQLSVGYGMNGDGSSCRVKEHQYASTDAVQSAPDVMISVFVHDFRAVSSNAKTEWVSHMVI